MKKNKIILAGSGYLGDNIIDLLDEMNHGYLITEISRSKKNRDGNVQSIQHDIDNSIHLDLDLEGSKIIYMAPPDTSSDGDLRIAKFITTVSKYNVERFIYISTSGVYGDCNGNKVNELIPVNPITDRAMRRVDAENKIIDFGRNNNVEILILRVPGIYGKNRLPMKRIINREPLIEKAQSRTTNLIHVQDLSRIVIKSLEVEIQETELVTLFSKLLKGLQFDAVVSSDLSGPHRASGAYNVGGQCTITLTGDSNPDHVRAYDHSHLFKNVPLNLKSNNDEVRQEAQSLNKPSTDSNGNPLGPKSVRAKPVEKKTAAEKHKTLMTDIFNR